MTTDNDAPKRGALPRPSDYRVARDLAWSELARRNPADVAASANVELLTADTYADMNGPVYRVPLFGEPMTVDVANRIIHQQDKSELVAYSSVLVLHYLVGARPGKVSDEWVTFRELEAGRFYLSAFRARTTDRLEPVLGPRPQDLVAAALSLGGEPLDIGDAGVRITLMPKAHIGVIVWAGDAELAPNVTMLFGRTAADIFSTEDLAVAGGLLAGRLIRSVRAM